MTEICLSTYHGNAKATTTTNNDNRKQKENIELNGPKMKKNFRCAQQHKSQARERYISHLKLHTQIPTSTV